MNGYKREIVNIILEKYFIPKIENSKKIKSYVIDSSKEDEILFKLTLKDVLVSNLFKKDRIKKSKLNFVFGIDTKDNKKINIEIFYFEHNGVEFVKKSSFLTFLIKDIDKGPYLELGVMNILFLNVFGNKFLKKTIEGKISVGGLKEKIKGLKDQINFNILNRLLNRLKQSYKNTFNENQPVSLSSLLLLSKNKKTSVLDYFKVNKKYFYKKVKFNFCKIRIITGIILKLVKFYFRVLRVVLVNKYKNKVQN